MKVINGEKLLLGRLCSYAAKAALLGEEVKIVNCGKVVVSGDRKKVFANERQKRERGGYPLKSPKLPRLPDRFVRKAVRGMLPHKKERGREAYGRVMCYVNIPEEFNSNMETIESANVGKLPTLKYVTVTEICNWLRGRK
ncbi:50S ribosomal protein L13 [Candidatus Woesearchaeota archaeon]|nr:50S ribosomal protein L13 [Candidatus Woesearchaeota archaeon]